MSIKLNIRYSLLCLVLFFATGSLAYAQQAQDHLSPVTAAWQTFG